jgi:hypothetical protein
MPNTPAINPTKSWFIARLYDPLTLKAYAIH